MFTIRRATLDDLAIIVDWDARIAKETEDKNLDFGTLTEGVRAALSDESKALYFVAETDGLMVGMLMITYEWSDWRNGQIWWIQSVYVHPEWRRRGVFRALYQHVHRLAQSKDVKGLRLYVEQANVAAQMTYAHVGMEPSYYAVFERVPI
ncbi:MAG: GNAT family N-acetyltransferase [Candidatus Poribacteria bacterium]|nr:GNAT family N-acetyltransferase [Candidatus Poribacteria bacterium]